MEMGVGVALATIGAGAAIGLAGLGSGIGVGITGAAGAGAVADNPDKFGTAIVFQALPQTQAIYGLLTAILILMGTGLLTGEHVDLGVGAGLAALGAGIAVGVAGFSAIGQGIAAASGIGATAEKPEMFGKGMVFSVLPETQAIYGLLTAILIMLGVGLLAGGSGEVSLAAGLASIGAGIAVGVAGLSAIGQGIAAASGIGATTDKSEMFGRGLVFSVLPETQAIYGLLTAILILLGVGLLGGSGTQVGSLAGVAAIGAGAAIGFAGLSGIGQGIAAASGIGATTEKPEMFGKSMVFSVLPETQAIYGLLTAILILLGVGLLGGGGMPTTAASLAAVGAGLAVGLAGLSGIGQGIAAAGGIGATTEKPEMFGKGMVFSVLPETQAIYGLLVAILLMVFTGLLGVTGKVIVGAVGLAAIGAGISVGLAGLSGIGQGITAAGGVAAAVKDPSSMGKSLVLSVMSETFAIFGLLIAILIMYGSGMFG